nr:uncharacterized protein LOC109179535 isoform X2 [Ipomoea batatas]
MEQVTESLSEESPSAVTPRSPEDEDLLQQSTKKSKRGRDPAEQLRTKTTDSAVQKTPAAAEFLSPYWRTPIETPSNVWGRRETTTLAEEQGEEKGSMNENQTQDHQENPQTNGDNRTAQQSRGPKRDYKQNFGDWMLVARKERRNFRKGGPRVPTTTGNNQYQMPFMNAGGPQLQSRYAVLDSLEEKEMKFLPEERPSSATMQNVLTTLPRIRTTQNQNSPRGQTIPQQGGRYQTNQGGRGSGGGQMAHYERGTTRGRGTRGGAPRRAAAESEHIVVRGSNRGKQIASSVVHHMNDRPEPSRRMDVDYELLGDPPDVPRLFENRPDKPGTSEMNEEGEKPRRSTAAVTTTRRHATSVYGTPSKKQERETDASVLPSSVPREGEGRSLLLKTSSLSGMAAAEMREKTPAKGRRYSARTPHGEEGALVGEKKVEAEAAAHCSASAKLESKVAVAAWRRWEKQRGGHCRCCLLLRDEVRREGRCCVHGRMPGRSPTATLSIVDDRCYTLTGRED